MDDHTPRERRPRVTVGLPVYNGQDHVGRAIESILAQTSEDFELIVSDNRSEDDTWPICLEYANRDSRVRCVRQETNIGANGNFNALFQLSRSRYFKWAGSDDQWHPTFLERCVDALDQNPAASLAYCGEAYLTDQDEVVYELNVPYHVDAAVPDQRFRQWMWAMESPRRGRSDLVYGLIRSHHLDNTRLFVDSIATNQLLLLELATLGPFVYIPEILVRRTPPPHRTIDQRMRRMDPEYRSRISLPHWERARQFLGVASNVDVSRLQRLELQLNCIRYFATKPQHRKLLWDLRRTVRSLAGASQA